MKMMERKAYMAFSETGFGKTGRHPCYTLLCEKMSSNIKSG